MGTAADSVAIGKRLMRKGLLSNAVRSFTRAMVETQKAEKAEAVLLRGACQLMLGNQTACLSDLDDVLERGIPELRSQALVLRACVLWRRGEFESSLQILEEVEDAGGLDTADEPLTVLDTVEVDLLERPGASKNGGHTSSAVASSQVTKTGNALESMLQDFFKVLASSELSSGDQLTSESDEECTDWNVDDPWDIEPATRYRYGDASGSDDSENSEEDDMEKLLSSSLRAEDLGNDDPKAKFYARFFDAARLSTGLNENWLAPLDRTTVLLAGGSHQGALLEGMELFWVAKSTSGPDTVNASLYDSDSDVEGTKESSFCVPLPAFYQRQGDLNSTSDGAANGFERLRNLCRSAPESTEVDSQDLIQALGKAFFGKQFADDSANLSKFFGVHVAEGSKGQRSASKRRCRPRKAKKTCSTFSCNLCWAEHLWQKRFGATTPGETTKAISHTERVLEALTFVLLLQVEARFSHREIPWEFDGLLYLSRVLAEFDEDQLVALGPLLLNYAERLEKEVLVGSTRAFDAFVLNAAEQVERSSSLSDFGARTGILLTEELKCMEATAERVADAWEEKRRQEESVGASSNADEQDPWVENQQASQSPESFVRKCLKIRSDHLIAELVERLQEGDYQAVERLASEAAVRRSDYCIINHVRAVCFLFQDSLRKCLRTCDDVLQRMEEVLEISGPEKQAMIQCVRELKGQCLMVTSRRNFVERAGLYLAELQRKLPRSAIEHTSADVDDNELSEATSNIGEESHRIASSSALSATNVRFYCAAEQCATGNRGLNTENKWAECRCANGCHLQFHKKCWRTFLHSRQTAMCTSDSCEGRIVTPGLFMTSDTMEDQRSRLDQIVRNQHHATPEPASVAEVSSDRPEEASLNPNAALKAERAASNVHLGAARVRGHSPGRISRDTTREFCSLCMMQLNSSAQLHKHLTGKRHQSAVASKFLDALKYRLSSHHRTSLPLSEFDDELQRLARDVRESFGSFAKFAGSYAAQIVVSHNERNELVVGSAPEPATDNRYFDRTAIRSAEMAGQGALLRDRSREDGGCLSAEVTESEAEEAAEFDAAGEALGLDDEVQFPPLGEERADPTILRLRELMTVRMSADDTKDERSCDICWGDIPPGHRVAVLPCGHSDLCLACVVNSYKRTPRNSWLCHKCRRPVEELQTEHLQRRALKVSQKKVNAERTKSSDQLRGAVL